MVSKARKGKGKKFHSKYEVNEEGKERDMSRVRCFHCHEHEHFTTNCPQKKKNKKVVGSVAGEALALKFELEFSLIASWCQVHLDLCGICIVVLPFA